MKRFAVCLLCAAMMTCSLSADVVLEDVCGSYTPSDFVNDLLGGHAGLSVSNVVSTGSCESQGLLELERHDVRPELTSDRKTNAVVLVTGRLEEAVRLFSLSGSTSTNNGQPGDDDLGDEAGVTTLDASVIEFDLVASDTVTIAFDYLFASEEYLEWVDSSFNDAFALFVGTAADFDNTKANVAVLPSGDVASINTINTESNPSLFVNNDDGSRAMEWDGRTTLLTTMPFEMAAGVAYRFKLVVGDGTDAILDSAVYFGETSVDTVECQTAAAMCAFEFENSEGSIATYDISATPNMDFAFSDVIVSKSSDIIGQVNSHGVDVVTVSGPQPIDSLDGDLTPTQFKVFGQWNGEQVVSRVAHETFQGARSAVFGQCFKVRFTAWQVLNAQGNVIDNVHASDPEADCVVFKIA